MIYKVKKTTHVFETKTCEYIENDIIKLEDLMITFWTPKNFKGKEKNYLLRRNHDNWSIMHTKKQIKNEHEWLDELNLDKDKFCFYQTSMVDDTIHYKIVEKINPNNNKEEQWEVHSLDKDKGVFRL